MQLGYRLKKTPNYSQLASDVPCCGTDDPHPPSIPVLFGHHGILSAWLVTNLSRNSILKPGEVWHLGCIRMVMIVHGDPALSGL
jgi:hypothetical protein